MTRPVAVDAPGVPASVGERIARGRYARTFVPRAFGGDARTLADGLDALERLAQEDASAAWLAMIFADSPILAALLPRETVEQLYAAGPDVIVSSSSLLTGTALPAPGGYTVSGSWQYLSGVGQAQWVLVHCRVPGPPDADRAPTVVAALLPTAAVSIRANWDVLGLEATGSNDVEVSDAFVPSARTFAVADAMPADYGPIFRVPIRAHFALQMGAIALGIARGALDALNAERSAHGHDVSPRRLGELALIDDARGRFDVQWRSLRAGLALTAEDAWRTAASGAPFPPEQRALMAAVAAHVAEDCAAIVCRVFEFGGTRVIRRDDPLQKRMRDVQTLKQHVNLSRAAFAAHGASLREPLAGR